MTEWRAVEPAWRFAFELAWESHCAGSPAVGAVVVDAAGAVVARGRSRRGENDAVPNQLSGSRMAHAEINALAGLTVDHHHGLRLLVTLEPCLLCAAATAIGHVTQVEFAGEDPVWRYVQDLPLKEERLAERWPMIHGPVGGRLASWGSLLPLLERLERRPDGVRVDEYEVRLPELTKLARSLIADGTAMEFRRLTLDEALDATWDRLPT